MRKFTIWCAGMLGGLSAIALQVGPHDAQSRIAEWAHFIGVEQVPPWLASTGADVSAKCALLVMFIFLLIWSIAERRKDIPFKIIFDPKNPSKRFWDHPRNPGIENPARYFEYRVEIKNVTRRTLEDVTVTIDQDRSLHTQLIDANFVRSETKTRKLHPLDSDLVTVITCWIGPRPGDFAGPTARLYGDFLVKVNARDTPQIIRRFHFDPTQVPVIFDDRTGNYESR